MALAQILQIQIHYQPQQEKILNNLLNSKNDKFSKNKAKEEKPKKKLVKKSEETERKVEGPKNDFQYKDVNFSR